MSVMVTCPRCKTEIEDWDMNKISLCIDNIWYEKKVCPDCFNQLYSMRKNAEMLVCKKFWEGVKDE